MDVHLFPPLRSGANRIGFTFNRDWRTTTAVAAASIENLCRRDDRRRLVEVIRQKPLEVATKAFRQQKKTSTEIFYQVQ